MGVGMAREERRMVYGLERDGRTVYCSSFAVVSALRALGWTLSDSGHWGQARAAADGWVPLLSSQPKVRNVEEDDSGTFLLP